MGFTFYLDDAGNSRLGGRGRHWVLGGLVLPDHRWRDLHNAVSGILNAYEIPPEVELKWSDAGVRIEQLRQADARQRPKQKTPLDHFNAVRDIRDLYSDLLDLIPAVAGARVMFVWCVKKDARVICRGMGDEADERCYRDMFHDALERYEIFLTRGDNAPGTFGHVVIDRKNGKFDRAVEYTCDELLRKGSAFVDIRHVVDGVHVGDSRRSLGLRMADYVVGAVQRHLESGDSGYFQRIAGAVHADGWGHVDGAGAKRFPSQQKYLDSLATFPVPQVPTGA